MRVAVLGAAGTIGPAIVADLAASAEITGLTLLDRDGARVRAVAERHGGEVAQPVTVDATDPMGLPLALEGHAMLVSAAAYRVNPSVMDACLTAGCSYADLGGLYHVAARQYRLHDAFAEAGLVAVLGCGSAPGTTNVLAAAGAALLHRVDRIRCASAGLDPDPPPGLAAPYALETLLDELTQPPMVVRSGEPVALDPLADGGTVAFPDPVGDRPSIHTLHSEVLTLAGTLGARDVDFRLSLSPGVQDALVALAARPPQERRELRPAPPSPRTWSAQHVELHGERDGEPAVVTSTALTGPDEALGFGGGVRATAAVAAATVRLFARGALRPAGFGVHPPETALPAELLLPELEARGSTFSTTVTVPRAARSQSP